MGSIFGCEQLLLEPDASRGKAALHCETGTDRNRMKVLTP
jgi:hypothetical protein